MLLLMLLPQEPEFQNLCTSGAFSISCRHLGCSLSQLHASVAAAEVLPGRSSPGSSTGCHNMSSKPKRRPLEQSVLLPTQHVCLKTSWPRTKRLEPLLLACRYDNSYLEAPKLLDHLQRLSVEHGLVFDPPEGGSPTDIEACEGQSQPCTNVHLSDSGSLASAGMVLNYVAGALNLGRICC